MVPSLFLPALSVSGRMTSVLTLADAVKPNHKENNRTSQPRGTHIDDDTFVEQALLLGSHDKIVGTVLVVNNVLKINP